MSQADPSAIGKNLPKILSFASDTSSPLSTAIPGDLGSSALAQVVTTESTTDERPK